MNQPLSRPILSVCVPTYNRAKWIQVSLPRWVEAARATWQEVGAGSVEIVVSDNASSDETPQVTELALQGLSASEVESGLLRVSRNSENIGGNPNFFKCAQELARGEWVWVVGDDDFPVPNALQRILRVLLDEKINAEMQQESPIELLYVPYSRWMVTGYEDAAKRWEHASLEAVPDSVPRPPRRAAQLLELVRYESHCFTPIYSFIVRREQAAAAFRGSLGVAPFSSAESVSSHAIYIARHLLRFPAYDLGTSCVYVTPHISWQIYHPIYLLKIIHEIYDAFEKGGVDPRHLEPARRGILRESGFCLYSMMFRRRTPLRSHFSLVAFARKNWRYKQFWQALATALALALYLPWPEPIRYRARDAIRGILRRVRPTS